MKHTRETLITITAGKSKYGVAPIFVKIGDEKLRHRVHHSPTGLGCGYEGSGAADLALSILDEVIDAPKKTKLWDYSKVSEAAWLLHQEFKHVFVAKWAPPVEITVGQVLDWVAQVLPSMEL